MTKGETKEGRKGGQKKEKGEKEEEGKRRGRRAGDKGRGEGRGKKERWEVRRIYICILSSSSITLKKVAYNVVGDELDHGGVVI